MTTETQQRQPGKPTSLTPAVIEALTLAMAKGHYATTACQLTRVPQSTFYDWLERGNKDLDQDVDSLYSELVDNLKRAEAQAEAEMLAVVRNSAVKDKNWIAAMTFLERRHPEKWGRKDRTRVDINESKEITVTVIEVAKGFEPEELSQAEIARLPEAEETRKGDNKT